MSILKRELFIEKAFENYLAAPGRVMFELNELTEMLKLEPKAFEIFCKFYDNTKSPKCITIFKWLILINKLLMDFVMEPSKVFEMM
jgi:hypothetical protein